MTTGSPTRLLIAFTLPILLGSLFQQLYSLTDAAVVGQILGPNALAAVGSVGSIIFLMFGFGWGTSAGLAIPIAKAFGANDLPGTRRAIAAGAYVTLGIAIVVTSIGLFGGQPLLRLMGTPEYLLPDAAAYLRIMSSGAVLATTFAFLGATVRAVGDTKTPLKFAMLSQLLNIALVVWFVAGLDLGVPGAAASTLIAQGITLVTVLWYWRRNFAELIPSRAEWRAGWSDAGASARLGIPMGLQSCAIAIGTVVLQAAVNGLGSESMAAFTAATRVEGIIIAPLHAFNMAVVTFVAQNRGAEQWHRIRHTVKRAVFLVAGVALSLGAFQFAFAPVLVRLFLTDDAAAQAAVATSYLRITAGLFVLLGLKFVVRGAVQGMGNTVIPLVSTLAELGVRIAATATLVAWLGMTGVAFASPLAWMAGLSINVVVWWRMRTRLPQVAGGKAPAPGQTPERVREVVKAA
ncbi:MAG: MATE family efflux transporter [Promicromonosporaceae bacterium]|nr:MATE family efflux transporter [Promicromonosporaceae bacterium]